MDRHTKIVIGIGTAVLVGTIGYYAYKLFKSREYAKGEIPHTSHRIVREERIGLVQLVDEVLIKGLEKLFPFLKSASMIEEQSEEVKRIMQKKLQREMEEEFYEIEKEICQQYNWDINEYRDQIEQRRNSKEVKIINRLSILTNIFHSIIQAKKPQITFTFNPILTKELTFILYKWTLCSYLYLFYQELHNALSIGRELNEDLIVGINRLVNPIKEQRKYCLECNVELI